MTDQTTNEPITGTATQAAQTVSIPGQTVSVTIPAQTITIPAQTVQISIAAESITLPSQTDPVTGVTSIDVTTLAALVAAILNPAKPPATLAVTATVTPATASAGLYTGTVSTVVSGGVTPYTTVVAVPGLTVAGSTLSGTLAAGTYPGTVTVTDSAGSTASASFAITASAVLPVGAGPSAVSGLALLNQGGPGDIVKGGLGAPGPLTNYQSIKWNAATAGANPISSYNVYRNGSLYANVPATQLTYVDNAAANCSDYTFTFASTVYDYDVCAVDTAGNVGPSSGQFVAYGYQNGASNWSNADLSYGNAVASYSAVAPDGTKCVSVTYPGSGGFLPVADAPMCPTWDLEVGAFNYFTIDVNPGATVDPDGVQLNLESRLTFGDTSAWANGFNLFSFGPTPKPNTWATYKIPLSKYHFGKSGFTGSISGTTLTVTAVAAGGFVDGGGFVTGPNVPAGTYISAYHQSGSIGTFTVGGPGINASTSVASEAMTFQRTNFYKFGVQPNSGNHNTMYFNNFGFTKA